MSKFKFDMSVVVDARDVDGALAQVASHISTCSRQLSSGVDGAGVSPEFDIVKVADSTTATDLTDKVVDKIQLDLDPNSVAGIQYKEQQAERAKAAERAKPDHRPDAEILAEFSAKEQGLEPAPKK